MLREVWLEQTPSTAEALTNPKTQFYNNNKLFFLSPDYHEAMRSGVDDQLVSVQEHDVIAGIIFV